MVAAHVRRLLIRHVPHSSATLPWRLLPLTTQVHLYEETGRRAVVDVLNGFNSCLLCYGQTGSGKTYSMFGPEGTVERLHRMDDVDLGDAGAGIAVRAVAELLSAGKRCVSSCLMSTPFPFVSPPL